MCKDLREKLAELEHMQWMQWSKELAKEEGLSAERLERWKKNWISYFELDEEAKEFDREWADKVLEILKEELIILADNLDQLGLIEISSRIDYFLKTGEATSSDFLIKLKELLEKKNRGEISQKEFKDLVNELNAPQGSLGLGMERTYEKAEEEERKREEEKQRQRKELVRKKMGPAKEYIETKSPESKEELEKSIQRELFDKDKFKGFKPKRRWKRRKSQMGYLQKLAEVANALDEKNHLQEADEIDAIIQSEMEKVAVAISPELRKKIDQLSDKAEEEFTKIFKATYEHYRSKGKSDKEADEIAARTAWQHISEKYPKEIGKEGSLL